MFTTMLQRRLFPRETDALPSFGRLFPTSLAFAPELTAYPPTEIVDSDNEYTVTVEVPGLTKEEVTIDFADGALTIAGEKKEEAKVDNQTYYLFERSYGAFRRAFTFTTPVDAEKIQADLINGVLTIHLPKVTARKELGKKVLIGEPPKVVSAKK